MIEIKNTLFVGKVLYQYKSLESTNDLAKEILSKSKPPEGTAISTYNQTKGRGQIGSSWQSEPDKNITCSIILYPSFLKAQEQFLLSQVAALAIYNTVKCLTYKAVYVKWPNDVLIENRKVAGILIQNSLAGERLNETVIGIGLNVNQSIFSKFDTQPTSLKLESNKVFALEEVLNVLFSNIEKWYLDLKNNRFQKIKDHYLTNLLNFRAVANYRDQAGNEFEGIIEGITKEGLLKVLVNGQMRCFALKEIKFLYD